MLAAAGPREFDTVLRVLAGSGEVDALVALLRRR